MPTNLTAEQRSDLALHGNRPVAVIDPVTQSVYYLVAGELFDRIRTLIDDAPFNVMEAYAAQSAAAGLTGWDDPEMDVYDDYDAHKRPL